MTNSDLKLLEELEVTSEVNCEADHLGKEVHLHSGDGTAAYYIKGCHIIEGDCSQYVVLPVCKKFGQAVLEKHGANQVCNRCGYQGKYEDFVWIADTI